MGVDEAGQQHLAAAAEDRDARVFRTAEPRSTLADPSRKGMPMN
ncbi:MAG TPA: hypothetical protein VJX94_08320 [Stellaceae bacterium]|nr:hypothetical protein [Stellaceae bacterium]